jgi:hypothetical protein
MNYKLIVIVLMNSMITVIDIVMFNIVIVVDIDYLSTFY